MSFRPKGEIFLLVELRFLTPSGIRNDRLLSLRICSTDTLREAGIVPSLNAKLRQIVGVGGTESVVDLSLDSLTIGSTKLDNFVIEIGAMDYGFDIEGIVGFDYLEQAGVILDFDKMVIRAN